MKTIKLILVLLSIIIVANTSAVTTDKNNNHMSFGDFIKREYDNFAKATYVTSRDSNNSYFSLDLVMMGVIGIASFDVPFTGSLVLKPFIYFYHTPKRK